MNPQETRTELFSALRALAETVPEMRAGQIMAALGELCADMHGRGLWDAEDAQVLEAIWKFRRDVEGTLSGSNRQLAAL
jgi:hypothetical protein